MFVSSYEWSVWRCAGSVTSSGVGPLIMPRAVASPLGAPTAVPNATADMAGPQANGCLYSASGSSFVDWSVPM